MSFSVSRSLSHPRPTDSTVRGAFAHVLSCRIINENHAPLRVQHFFGRKPLGDDKGLEPKNFDLIKIFPNPNDALFPQGNDPARQVALVKFKPKHCVINDAIETLCPVIFGQLEESVSRRGGEHGTGAANYPDALPSVPDLEMNLLPVCAFLYDVMAAANIQIDGIVRGAKFKRKLGVGEWSGEPGSNRRIQGGALRRATYTILARLFNRPAARREVPVGVCSSLGQTA